MSLRCWKDSSWLFRPWWCNHMLQQTEQSKSSQQLHLQPTETLFAHSSNDQSLGRNESLPHKCGWHHRLHHPNIFRTVRKLILCQKTPCIPCTRKDSTQILLSIPNQCTTTHLQKGPCPLSRS